MKNQLILKVGENHTIPKIVKWLIDSEYERVNGPIHSGQFFVSGENLAIYSGDSFSPIKIEFFGNKIEKLFTYNQKSFKRIKSLKLITINKNILILEDKSKIHPGDYVVHLDHGIGIFSGFISKKVAEEDEKYIVIKYLKEDCLYVPKKLVSKISRYIGIGRKTPRINRLGSQSWKKTYKKTYDNIIQFARELITLYAKREIATRPGIKINQDWNKEIVRTFGYDETDCQTDAINKTFNDLIGNHPMDRLICGDVGFGKTEVAIRAASQMCASGYQVAILVPTTILCEQHYVTLKNRFKNLPVNISHLSRFIEKKNQSEIVNKIAEGNIDILIATHRIFSKDIKFKNLGLLVIDEEQKFGVKDKEKLKKIREWLNILALTATPIPRTLFMALSGLRDISQIYTPPMGRKEIKTKVSVYKGDLTKQYIERELEQEGQVYYLHNEVQTIEGTKSKIVKMFPKKNVAVAHGQMSEKMLAKTMSQFSDGKIDILVCSTIIENGLDLPNVNTLIVENSDKFGLSQLYQIRGRIGRSPKQAYALFSYKDKKITDNAFKRFKALVENTELGSGYNIALSDLEIRGGGNILGREQHGNMEAVGLVLYSTMLTKAVEKLNTQKV